MHEQRLQAYLNLIQALLSCPSGEEQTILAANQELIDAGLVQMMLQVANDKTGQGDLDNANRLMNIAGQLLGVYGNSSAATTEEALNFLLQVLRATIESNGNPQVVYPLLQENLDKLDDTFAQVLQRWADEALTDVESEQAQSIAAIIGNFSNLITDFPLGNRASNLEIAITGYESALQVYNRTDFPVDWAMTQNNLGIAYRDRIREDRAENLEEAIKCYQQALEVYTRIDFPVNWAATQNNLGNAYGDRIREDRAENLEEAIKCYQQALKVRTRTDFPVNWAMTQNNLGLTYSDRIRGERAQNLEDAIHCYQQALLESTRKRVPLDWAATAREYPAKWFRGRHS